MRNLLTLSRVDLNKEVASLIEIGMFPSLRNLGLFISPQNNCERQQLLHSLKNLTRLHILKFYPGNKKDGRHGIEFLSFFQLKADTFPSSITKIT